MTTQSNQNRGGNHEQHVRAGGQSHKNTGQQQQASPRSASHDQQMNAGQQNPKNANGPNSGNSASGSSGSGTRGGSSEQHAASGRQSHKNT